MVKGNYVEIRLKTGKKKGLVVSTEPFNMKLGRFFFVPADEGLARHGFEVQAIPSSQEGVQRRVRSLAGVTALEYQGRIIGVKMY